jgi:hypothetical protein
VEAVWQGIKACSTETHHSGANGTNSHHRRHADSQRKKASIYSIQKTFLAISDSSRERDGRFTQHKADNSTPSRHSKYTTTPEMPGRHMR